MNPKSFYPAFRVHYRFTCPESNVPQDEFGLHDAASSTHSNKRDVVIESSDTFSMAKFRISPRSLTIS